MSRVLRFPDDPVGQVQVVADGKREQLPAQGAVEIPTDAKAFVALDEGAAPGLGFLADVDDDILVGLSLGTIDDAGLGVLAGLSSLAQLEATLDEPGDAGLAALAKAPLKVLWLHGDPGSALGDIARSTTIVRLHIHLERLSLDALRSLATSTHLDHLDIEVGMPLDADDEDVVHALVAVASGLTGLGVTTADGSSGLSTAVRLAILRSCEGLSLDGTSYTPAALARLEQKLASV